MITTQLAWLGETWPDPVWISGALPADLEQRRRVAIVGARAASRRSLELARELGCDLSRRGIVVISGGALGVDGAAHQGALEGAAEGAVAPTIAVLGTGIDVPYPTRHRRLFDVIAERGVL